MSIKCKICNQEFKKIITNSHLKKHGISTDEYKKKFGDNSMSCPEYRKARAEKMKGKNNPNYGNKWTDEMKSSVSEKLKGRDAWNKGLSTSEEVKNKQSETKKKLFIEGKLQAWNKGKTMSNESRAKVSESLKKYYDENPEIKEKISKRAYQQSLSRKKFNPFEGSYISTDAKQRMKQAITDNNKRKKEEAFENFLAFLEDEGIELIEYNDPYVKGRCKCGKVFEVTRQNFHPSKYKDKYCQFCIPNNRSRMELEVEEFLRYEIGCDLLTNVRGKIYPYELDLLCEESNIAVEFCGLYWHSELQGKDRNYHREKLELCREKGIKLIQIFEHEWLYKQNIVKSMLRAKFGMSKRLYARKCEVLEISSKKANEFLNVNHLSGSGRSNKRYGLFYDNEIVGVMTLSESNISRKHTTWEINRMAFKQGVTVVGGASKMFNRFIKDVAPKEVVSFAELRYGEGMVYSNIGFEKVSDTLPNYWYFKILGGKDYLEVKHRFTLRKNYKEGIDDPNKTEWENRQEQGWNRIWDCGHAKWIWKNGNNSY